MCRTQREPDGPRSCSSHAKARLSGLAPVLSTLTSEQQDIDSSLRGPAVIDQVAQAKLNRILGLDLTPQQRADRHLATAQLARDAVDRHVRDAKRFLADGDPEAAESSTNRAAASLRDAKYYTARAEAALSQ